VNMTPPLIARTGFFKVLARPIDFNKRFFGQPVLGNHKTWRGLIFGFFAGIIIVFIQRWLYEISFFQKISFLNYKSSDIFLFAILISFGAVFGDLFFAFIKRRLNLKPGARFLPFDQTNYVIGAFIILEPFLKLNLSVWLTIFISTFFLHIIFNRLGYLLGLHRNKW